MIHKEFCETLTQISQVRIARMTNYIFNKILDLERGKGKEGPRKVRKFHKRNKNFSCYCKKTE